MSLSLGVIFLPSFPPETLPDFARRAETAGFDELWLWDDAFLPGALTSAAVALASTQRITVGIGLLPATAYNPLFAAMEITTLARLYPDRLLVGFGHGVDRWMKQIGANPKSSMSSLAETVDVVRRLLQGETISMLGTQVFMDDVKMEIIPKKIPPLYVGAMREKTLQLAGRIADGTILTAMASPAYVRWAKNYIQIGMSDSGNTKNRIGVYELAKVQPNGVEVRRKAREVIARQLKGSEPQLAATGILDQARTLIARHETTDVARALPDEWIDQLTATGTPEQVAASIMRLNEAGADSVILQPLDGDPVCLDEYAQYLMPMFKR